METKICKTCGVEKSVNDFHKSGVCPKSGVQYYKTTCKECVNKGSTPRTDNIDPKPCSRCGEIKSLSEYGFDHKRQRWRADCKACKYARRLEYRAENPEVAQKENLKKRERWKNDPEYVQKQKETHKKSYEKNGEKWRENFKQKYTNDPEYREKILQRRKDLWKNNLEYRKKLIEKNKIYYQENIEKIREQRKEYNQINKERIRERAIKYKRENEQHVKKLRRALYEKHQKKLVNDQRRIRNERRKILKDRLGGKCVRCGTTERLEFDHIIQENKSFTIGCNITVFSIEELIKEVDKCQLLCKPCHIQKSIECGDYGPGSKPHLSDEARAKRIRK